MKKVCIIGSGFGGSVAAKRLADSNLFDVSVIDVNKLDSSTENQLEIIYTRHEFDLDKTRFFGFGGTSNLWHGLLCELDDIDFHYMDLVSNYNLSREIKKSYRNLKDIFPSFSKCKLKHPTMGIYKIFNTSSFFVRKNFFLQKKPLRTKKLLFEVSNNKNVKIIDNAVAIELIKNDETNSIEKVLINKDGRFTSIYADIFILSSGCIETPRILLQGGVSQDFTVNNNIGKALVDHPWTVIGEINKETGRMNLHNYDARCSSQIWSRTNYIQNNLSKGNWDNHCISLKPSPSGDYNEFKDSLKSLLTIEALGVRSLYSLFRKYSIFHIVSSMLLLIVEKFGLSIWVKKVLVFMYLEQRPNKNCFVKLSKKVDEYGRMIPVVNYEISERDVLSVSKMSKKISQIFNNLQDFNYKEYDVDNSQIYSGSHYAGTARIGSDSDSGVIDHNLKIFEFDNAYVCDLSIFPNYGNSNPTYTLCALSDRLSRYLIRQERQQK